LFPGESPPVLLHTNAGTSLTPLHAALIRYFEEYKFSHN
jgi:hypothetical protein